MLSQILTTTNKLFANIGTKYSNIDSDIKNYNIFIAYFF